MNSENSQTPANGREPSAEERLESWKEISAYLKRDVRTLRRWEKKEGMPVHRHMHEKLPSVYAFKSEIDAWFANRRPRLESETDPQKVPRRKPVWLLLGTAAVLVIAGLAVWKWFPRSPALPFRKRDWVLIAGFDNRTGEKVFDGTLEYALERELSQSRFVNVVPRERINDTLRLMKRSPETPLNRAVAREICLRDGGIRAFVTGRVEKLGSTYVLSAALVEPDSDATVSSFSQEARSRSEVAGAVRVLSNRVRETLGEELTEIRQSNRKLEKVTTPSLEALQLYSRAAVMVNEYRWEAATPVVAQALDDDPGFASAHILMAFCLLNTGQNEKAAAQFRRAFELAGTATPREAYFIRGCYYMSLKENEKAEQAFKALLELYPGHYWGVMNLMATSVRLGRPESAIPYVVRYAQVRRNDFEANFRAAYALAGVNDDRQAHVFLERARALASQTGIAHWKTAGLKLFPAVVHWQKGEVRQALDDLNRTVGVRPQAEAAGNPFVSWQAAALYLALGRPRDADRMMQPLSEVPRWRHEFALIPIVSGNRQTFRLRLQSFYVYPSYRSVILLARGGRMDEAEKMFADPESARTVFAPTSAALWKKLARGELDMARGDTSRGIAILKETLPQFRPWPNAYYFLCVESLADAWERRGRSAKALELFEEAAQEKNLSVFNTGAAFWMRAELERAGLLRRLGRESEAQQIEHRIADLLAVADPNFALLKNLHRQQALSAKR